MADEKLKIGASKEDVTPAPGLLMAGYGGRKDPAEETHMPLWARACVCAQGGQQVALVVVDVVGFSRQTTQDMRRAIWEKTGIEEERILIATTHTHSGPVTTKFRDVVPDPAYMATLTEKIVKAVSAAQENVTPVRMGFVQREEPEFHHNRRNADQPIDSTLGLVRFVSEDGKTVATWINYACHPTILTGKNLCWSTDFPGVLCNEVEKAWGGTAVFFNGCLGDVGPYRLQQTFAEVEEVGRGLAGAVLGLGEAMVFEKRDRLEVQSVLCRVPLDDAPDEETLREEAARTGTSYEADWAKDQLAARAAGQPVATDAELEMQAFRVGDVVLACFPGQLFGAWGLELRQRWPDERLLIVNQANDHAGYFPSKSGWEAGGYEANSAFKFNSDLPAPMTWTAGERLVEVSLTLV